MATYETRRWQAQVAEGLPRRDRRSCDYETYLPDPLVDRRFIIEGLVAADISDAEGAIRDLNATSGTLAYTEALARLLLRAESVASSRIEGLEVGGRRLLKTELERGLGVTSSDVTATEVLANIDAMQWSVTTLANADSITVEGICEVHRRLLSNTSLAEHSGVLRAEQNWIGGSSYNPCSAAFVPPPPTLVPDLMNDLCEFMNGDSLSPVAQAAMAHAQFESIHPFVDGNGRTGRALVHVVLRRRGLATHLVPPISLVLATRSREYIEGLTVSRYDGEPTSGPAVEGTSTWLSIFAAACTRSVVDASAFEERIGAMRTEWIQSLGQPRANSATSLLLDQLPAAPLITVQSAANLIGRSEQAVNEAVARLVAAGVLEQINIGRRNRAFQATDVIDAFTDLERQLASPDADTLTSPPVRRVPHRRMSRKQ